MKGNILLFILAISFCSVSGAIDTLKVRSKVTNVTVFYNGAQVTRNVFVTALKGRHLVVIRNVSPELDARSIQVNIGKGCTILSVKSSLDMSENTKKSDAQKELQEKIDGINHHIEDLNTKKTVLESEEKFLSDNSLFNSEKATNQLATLKAALVFYQTQISEIREEKLKIARQILDANDEIATLNERINALNSDKPKVFNRIILLMECSADYDDQFTITYYITSAGWTPMYDFRVDDISMPLSIVYNANVFQSSGENWDNVHLILSGNNPMMNNTKPELQRWNLGQDDPNQTLNVIPGVGELKGRVYSLEDGEVIPGVSIVLMQNDKILNGSTTDLDGQFAFKPVQSGVYKLKVSAIGFKTQRTGPIYISKGDSKTNDIQLATEKAVLAEVQVTALATQISTLDKYNSVAAIQGKVSGISSEKIDGQRVKQNFIENSIRTSVTNVQNIIELPYTIMSDGMDNMVKMKEIKLPVEYLFYLIPKLDNEAYLVARITDWNELNLVNGDASIYFEGSYVGQTQVRFAGTSDTIMLSLGRDPNIVAQREFNKKHEDKKMFGTSLKDTYDFSILVRNNRSSTAHIIVEDQYPVSTNKACFVNLIDSSGAMQDKASGKLTWDFILTSGQKREMDYKLQIKYD